MTDLFAGQVEVDKSIRLGIQEESSFQLDTHIDKHSVLVLVSGVYEAEFVDSHRQGLLVDQEVMCLSPAGEEVAGQLVGLRIGDIAESVWVYQVALLGGLSEGV